MRWRAFVVAATVALPLLCLPAQAALAGIAFSAPNPAANIPVSYPSTCQSAPSAAPCEQAGLAALNHARAVIHLPAYALPATFASLSAPEQLLTLSNADRAVYGRPAIRGLNATLNAAAQVGVVRDTDPAGPSSVSGVAYRGWASNWAAGWASPLFSYYSWMYDDGLGSGNIACTRAGDAGCWGHRQNVLADFGANQVAMGVGTGTSPRYHLPAFTTLYEAFPTTGALPYIPTVTEVTVSAAGLVTLAGTGFVGVRSVRIGAVTVAFALSAAGALVLAVPPGTGPAAIVVTTSGGSSTAIPFAGLAPLPAGSLVALPAARLLAGTSIPSGGYVLLAVAGRGGVPASGASAVRLSVQTLHPAVPGTLTVFPHGGPSPATASMAFNPGRVSATLVLTQLPGDGHIYVRNNATRAVRVVVDVTGWFVAGTPTAAATMGVLSPTTQWANGGLGTRSGVSLAVPGVAGVPDSPDAVWYSVTVAAPTGALNIAVGSTLIRLARGQAVSVLVGSLVRSAAGVPLYSGGPGLARVVVTVVAYRVA